MTTMHTVSSATSHPVPAVIPTDARIEGLADLPQRIRDIATLRGLGYSLREIASQLDVTPQAVSLMLSRHQRALKSLGGAIDLQGLSSRAVNALGRHGISSRKQARERNVLPKLRGARNCGPKTLREIESWLGEESMASRG
ncbi:MAG: sigma-70 family RNA polymerase sigma factor [Chthoniobacterales bacterium]|nr:sigma-70 family RNA polymerase sigma factor [Chthoniobacterales bacterium]